MLIKEIYKEIEKDFPLKKACKWDYSGHQYGKKNYFIKRIIVSLDLTNEVIIEAINNKIDIIITHHPFYFGNKKKIKQINYKINIINLLNKYKISVYSLHTNYDGFINEMILKELNPKKIITFDDFLTKIGYVNLTINEIITKLKIIFKITTIQHNFSILKLKKMINTVAILAGSSGNTILKIKKNIDLFITGEIKWDQWLIANEKKLSVICFNHYMEDFFTKIFTEYLIKKFPKLKIIPFHIKNIINYY